jgi:glycosyltransferase involved in cell wall biosynthesis
MIHDTPPSAAALDGPVVFINLWAEGGMKHYSESLVHALAPAAEVLYVRNYKSCVPVSGRLVELFPTRLSGWMQLLDLAREILRRRPAAVHLNSELPILLPLFPLFASFNSVITLHDAVPHDGERLSKRIFMRLHLLLVFVFIRKVIVHSTAIRDQLPGFLRARTHLLPHVNYRLWARREAKPAGDGRFIVLFFGRLLRYKGLDYLLEEFRRLDSSKFELIIAGEGNIAEYDVQGENIRIINRFIPDEEMAVLFNEAHAIALPYVAASQSGVAYMAFAFEKPVVATRVGALADVVVDDQNGYLIQREEGALGGALTRMAEPATYDRLVETVRRQNFSADEEIRSRLMEIYRE